MQPAGNLFLTSEVDSRLRRDQRLGTSLNFIRESNNYSSHSCPKKPLNETLHELQYFLGPKHLLRRGPATCETAIAAPSRMMYKK